MTAPARRPRSHPVPSAEPLALTPSRRRLLRLLHDYRHLTPGMLALLYTGGTAPGARYVRNELSNLFHARLAVRSLVTRRPTGSGSSEFAYAVTPSGARAVLSDAEWLAERRGIYRRAGDRRNLEHALSVAGLHLLLALGSTPAELEEFTGDHEHHLSRVSVTVPGLGSQVLWPDAEAIVRLASGRRRWLLFEIDLARKSNPRIADRFRGYAAHLARLDGASLHRRQIDEVAVVFVAPGPSEIRRLVLSAHALVSERVIPSVPPFLFWEQASWRKPPVDGADASAWDFRDPLQVVAEAAVIGLDGQRRSLLADDRADGEGLSGRGED